MKSAAQIAIEALDEVARAMEVKWGVGRLDRLVAAFNPHLAQRFHTQLDKLNAACETGMLSEQEIQAHRMRNAWMALDAAAEAAGADRASPRYLTARMSDGRLLAICASYDGMQDVVREWVQHNKGQAAAVWTIDEVAKVLEGFDLVNRTRHLFEGAVVEDVRVKRERYDWGKGDNLPDSMLMAG